MGSEHRVGPPDIHHDWWRDRAPALSVRPGDVVRYDIPITGEGQVAEASTIDEVEWDFDTIYNLAGPVFVEGAEPGDTLEVEVLELEPGPWGWTAFIPELGLLPDDFPIRPEGLRPAERVDRDRRTRGRRTARSVPRHDGRTDRGARGALSVSAPPRRGKRGLPPPRRRLHALAPRLVRGGALLLWRRARRSGRRGGLRERDRVRDGGNAQIRAHKRSIPGPAFHVPRAVGDPGPRFGTMGIDADLMEGARMAVRNMISWLGTERGMSREDAYVLCRLAGDLRIHEIVDGVSGTSAW